MFSICLRSPASLACSSGSRVPAASTLLVTTHAKATLDRYSRWREEFERVLDDGDARHGDSSALPLDWPWVPLSHDGTTVATKS
jgi:hypothetical protein